MVVNDDIDAIILRGEERTAELNSKYEGLNLEDLNNFKSDASVQQWEGEDFRPGVCHYRSTYVFPEVYYRVRKKPSTSICYRYRNGRENRTTLWTAISRIPFVLVHLRLRRHRRYRGRQNKLLCKSFDLT